MRNLLVKALVAVLLFANSAFAADPLATWNDGRLRQLRR